MHSKLLQVHKVLYISKLHCLWNVNFYILYISTLSLYNCKDSNFLWPIVVISWLKALRPKFNAYILNLKGPKKVGQGPKFGPGAHGLDSPAIGHRKAEQRIKSVLNDKQHKRVNENSLNELFLLNMFKQIELLPPTRDR